MKCFHFFNGEKKEHQMVKKKMSSISHDTRRSGSEFNSLNVSDASADSSQRPPLPSSFQSSNSLRVFMFSDMKGATKNFSRSLIVGQGGFGCVFRGSIKSLEDPRTRIEVAIKQLSHRGLQGHKEWLTEVNFLGVVEHPNLVKLVGYCAEDDERGTQRLLVYEFMSNGSVLDHLSSRSTTPLSWDQRLRIALDAARGLTYLHEEMEFQIIFRDLKTSNILLDEHWNAKLSDFGLARQGPVEGLSHVSTAVVGTVGYAAPEYIHTGRLTAKSDIWSYGVVLYELVTGRRPMDRNRPKSEQKLLEWVKPYISDPKKFPMIIDPRLVGHCSPRSAMKLAAIANKCLVRNPKSRPKISEVVKMVQSIIESEERGTPEIPLRSYTLGEEKSQEKKRAVNLKRRIGEFKMGGFVLKKLAPKLSRTR